MKVLLIDNYDSFVYNLAQLVEETGICELEVISYDKVNETIIERFDKFIISPGPGTPSDFPNLVKFVRLFHQQKDILGVCLGFEAIALAFGGEIKQSGKIFHGFTKKTTITEPRNFIFDNIPDEFEAGLYHSWIVNEERFPAELKIIARATDDIIMAFSHRDYNTAGLLFHPESIMTKEGKTMIWNWLNFTHW